MSGPGPATRPSDVKPTNHLSWKERVGLVLHRDLDKLFTPVATRLYRRTKGGLTARLNVDVLLLTTTGRRSGKERTVVLQYFPDGDSMMLAAANDGGQADPAWYLNLKANPVARAEVGTRAIDVHAEELSAEEAAAWWPRIVERDANYERYARATSRRIPLMRLDPVAGRQPGDGLSS
jgi:deazaflavin-dependent oxidoreductase (nitroreductase family)